MLSPASTRFGKVCICRRALCLSLEFVCTNLPTRASEADNFEVATDAPEI